MPPKFIVELFAFKEGSEVEVSINEWLINSLVPVIEKIGKNNMVCAAYFDQPDLDPFSKSKQNSSEGIVLGQSVLHKDCAVVLHKDNAVALKTKNSEKEYYANRNRLAHLLATNDNKKSSPSRTVDNSPINSEPCSKTFELTSIKPTKEGRSQKRIFQFESVINVPEFRPENRVIRNDTLDSSKYCFYLIIIELATKSYILYIFNRVFRYPRCFIWFSRHVWDTFNFSGISHVDEDHYRV